MTDLTKKWRVNYTEMDLFSGPDHFHVDYDSFELAQAAKEKNNKHLGFGPTPDYYVIAEAIEEIFVDEKGRKFKAVE